jgi:hypothetical protein
MQDDLMPIEDDSVRESSSADKPIIIDLTDDIAKLLEESDGIQSNPG